MKNKMNFDMLDNVRRGNRSLQQKGRKRLERLYKRSQKGVQLRKLY